MAAVCNMCKTKGQKNDPVEWCPECQNALCSSCSQHHNLKMSFKDHQTIPYDNYLKLPPFIKNISQKCSSHNNERYQFLCRDHDQLICNKCRQTKHKKCTDTPILMEIVKNVKVSNAFEDVTCEIIETSDILQKCLLGQRRNLNVIQNQREEMARNVEETMERLMAHLKIFKQNMLSDIDAIVKENENEILVTIQTLRAIESRINEINQKEPIKLYASNLQTFIGIKEMEKIVEDSKRTLTELSENESLDCPNLIIDQAKNIETSLTYDQLFGIIKAAKTSKNFSIETSKTKQSQMKAHLLPDQLQLQQELELRDGFLSGCCTLPCGLMVIAAYTSHQLKLINPDGIVKSTIRVKHNPNGVTTVDENQVAVSHDQDETISIVDVHKKKVTKIFTTQNNVSGIFYLQGHIILCVPYSGISKLNFNTETVVKIINDKTVSDNSCVVAGSERICYTCPVTNTITVLNSQYNVIFKTQGISLLEYPRGVTIDSHNNMYVTGYSSYTLVVISPDGKKVHHLLTEDDGLYSLTSVHCCHYTNQLIAVSRQGTVHIYSL